MVNRIVAALGIVFATVCCACGGTAPIPSIEATTFAAALNVDLPSSTRTADGEYYRDLVVGTGAPVAAGQKLTVDYSGFFVDGSKFDSSASRGPFSFVLGAHEVIAGWDEGLAQVRVGSTRQLIIPPALGYGASGAGPIPPNSILVFTVRVNSAQ